VLTEQTGYSLVQLAHLLLEKLELLRHIFSSRGYTG